MAKCYIVNHFWWNGDYDDYELREDKPLAFTSRETAETYIKQVFDKLVELGECVNGAFHEDGMTGCDIRLVEKEDMSRDGERWMIIEVDIVDNITNLGEIEL